MSITELSVKKPMAVIMIVLLFVALGIFGYSNMGADLQPSVNMPIITVSTAYNGASPEEIENGVVKPMEDALSSIGGIDKMNSVSQAGYGYTTIQFTMETNMETAFMDVQQAVSNALGQLPADASKPMISKTDMNASAVMILSVSSDLSYGELYNSADKIKNSLQKVDGVGTVTLEGGVQKEVRINVDRTLADQYEISISTIIGTLQSVNVNAPAGQLEQGNYNDSIRVVSQFKTVEEIQSIEIPMSSGATVRLDQIAEVKQDYPNNSELIRINGKESIGIFVKKQSDANIVKTVGNIKKELMKVEKKLPKGVNVSVAQDSSTYIKGSLKGVETGIIEGIITTSIVMFIFLKHFRASMIVLVAIPTSLISSFFMMYLFKFTLNTISLLALSLCIGILVDDSIVVIENIQRHLKQGKSLIRATIEGRKEIAMAAISITLCDIVVFGPIAFMSGMVGQFFKQFGLTVVFAALISLIISFTLTPMLASRLLEEEKVDFKEEGNKKGRFGLFEKLSEGFNKAFDGFNYRYKNFLIYSLNNRKKVLIAVILMLVFSGALIPLKAISTEFMPLTDQGSLTIDVTLSPNSNIKITDDKVKEVENHLTDIKEIKEYLTVIGDSNGKESVGKIYVTLVNKQMRKKNQSQIAAELRKWSKTVTGVQVSVSEAGSTGSGGASKPVSISIVGTQEEVLKELVNKIENSIESIPGLIDLDSSINATQNEININVDKLMASKFGVKPSEITSTLRAVSKKGSKSGVLRKDGSEYDIIVKFDDGHVSTVEDIEAVKITNSQGQQVTLGQIAKVTIEDTTQEKRRTDREEMVTLSANINGRTLGDVTEDIQNTINKIHVPDGYEIKYGGDQQMMADTFTSLIQVLIISILLVYSILVVLYESFLTPAIRMLSLPCATIGALVALAITGNSLNMVTMIGLVMLDGLAAKNGTLLIDYTNTLTKKGLTLREALIEAGDTRLKPIIMTSVTMIVGMLPSALALSEGSEYRAGMSITIIGGVITSTLISPILIPVVYTLMDDLKGWISRKKNKANIYDKGRSKC